MVKPAPSRFNPELLARQSELLGVSFPVASAKRLVELLADDTGEVNGTFKARKQGDRLSVSGHFDTEFTLTCQRCLSPFSLAVSTDFDFVLVNSQQEADELPDDADPVILADDGMLHVVDMLEDELILQVPTVPKHAAVDDCEFAVAVDVDGDQATQIGTQQRQSGSETFAALKNLRFDKELDQD